MTRGAKGSSSRLDAGRPEGSSLFQFDPQRSHEASASRVARLDTPSDCPPDEGVGTAGVDVTAVSTNQQPGLAAPAHLASAPGQRG
jgi:hypothetical protein